MSPDGLHSFTITQTEAGMDCRITLLAYRGQSITRKVARSGVLPNLDSKVCNNRLKSTWDYSSKRYLNIKSISKNKVIKNQVAKDFF